MTEVLLIDFSKAFDSVPHQRLLLKFNYYGITGNSVSWIENFLLDRTQYVQVSGTRSSWISVTPGVPQDTVIGPLLFLIYINDIVHNLNSKIKLFADDAVLYSEVSNVHDVSLFQQDLDTLSCWAATWQMNFNLTKCNIMSFTRSPLKFPAGYRLCNSPLESISCHKYLGVFIQDNLEWDSHVKSVKHKAMKILGLLGRNFSGSSQYVKTQGYNSLVRPHVEYASAAWSPFEKQHIKALEAVQCCAIRFVCSDYSQFCSVTSMQHSLGWDTLEVRRHLNTATIMYKAVHNWTHLTFPASVTLAQRSNRSNHPHKFRHIFARTNAYKFSFFPLVIPLWNGLPNSAVNAESVTDFQANALPSIGQY